MYGLLRYRLNVAGELCIIDEYVGARFETEDKEEFIARERKYVEHVVFHGGSSLLFLNVSL